MASFFEKLKKGMGVEIPGEEESNKEEMTQESVQRKKRVKKTITELEIEAIEPQEKEDKKISKPSFISSLSKAEEGKKAGESKEKWFEQEGQLAVDVYQTNGELVIQSAIAGVKPSDLDISIEGDVVLIRGSREKPLEEEEINYFYQECYWGPFSRQIILPEEADPNRAEAVMKEGVLTIRIPKIQREKKRKIVVKA